MLYCAALSQNYMHFEFVEALFNPLPLKGIKKEPKITDLIIPNLFNKGKIKEDGVTIPFLFSGKKKL